MVYDGTVAAGLPENPSSLLIFRALRPGDMLCSVPALRALRTAFPHTRIVLLSLPWAREFSTRYNYFIDDHIDFPGWPGISPSIPDARAVIKCISAVRKEKFDIVLQMNGSGLQENPFIALLGTKTCAGFTVPEAFCPDNDRFFSYPDEVSEIERSLMLLEYLGIPSQGDQLEFPLHKQDWEDLASIAETAELKPGRYVCINPGAPLPSRQWMPERFAAVADYLSFAGFQPVITGAAEEVKTAKTVSELMRSPHVNLAGKTTPGALAALLHDARMLVSNDTSISQVADAVGTQSIIISSGSDPCKHAPGDRRRHRVIYHPIKCRPCVYDVCPIGQSCSRNILVQTVIHQIENLLHDKCLQTA
jgi:ADP-heptose:LPS heptosyltransferase